MRKIKLTFQYDGSEYNGWQLQPSCRTIQGLMQEAVYRLTGEKANIIGAGRTDAGVHAIEQVAVFESSSSMDSKVIKKALNAVLPPDVRIVAAEDTDSSFHPRYSATRKRYTYLIANMPDTPGMDVPPLFFTKYMWWIKNPLDIVSMKAASAHLCGTHDFSSFRGSGCGAKSPVRTVYLLDIEQLSEMSFLFAVFPGNFMKLSIEANGFLRHMVRNIVGTLVETGRSRMSPDKVREILLARDRRLAGPTAPAKGLFLERVIYPLSL